jgi:spore maturation protein CgeB
MRILILNTDYTAFTKDLYKKNPGLSNFDYATQHRVRMESMHGVADFFSTHLRSLGHDVQDSMINSRDLQSRWAEENNVRIDDGRRVRLRRFRGKVPVLRFPRDPRWLYQVVLAQVKKFQPDVVFVLCIEALDTEILQEIKKHCRLLIGQHAAPLVHPEIMPYDLMLSSLPNQVEYFRDQGLRSRYLRLGFEPKVLASLPHRQTPQMDIAFVGSIGSAHSERSVILESLADHHSVGLWSDKRPAAVGNSNLAVSYKGMAWGLQMYEAVAQSKIGFNGHIDIAEGYSNNMRLYETTGVGSMLLTDAGVNLDGLFRPDVEVVRYSSVEECIELADHLLEHPKERESIARAGQKRTLADHSWEVRMQELSDVIHGEIQ